MEQRIEITEKGKVIIKTDNATIKDDIKSTIISGSFIIDAKDIARLSIMLSENKIAIGYSYFFTEGAVVYSIVDKNNEIYKLIDESATILKDKNDEIESGELDMKRFVMELKLGLMHQIWGVLLKEGDIRLDWSDNGCEVKLDFFVDRKEQ